jgi:prepilin-type N-terminal cleavage/methylation domain-containing protein
MFKNIISKKNNSVIPDLVHKYFSGEKSSGHTSARQLPVLQSGPTPTSRNPVSHPALSSSGTPGDPGHEFSDWIPASAGMTQGRRMTERKKAFTLIELMVSVALFSIVVMISMTAILSVVDSTKKAQSMKSVMNNLNFALETMTRSIKTGTDLSVDNGGVSTKDQNNTTITYSLGSDDKATSIVRTISGNAEAITAPEVNISNLKFISGGAGQPSVIMVVQGTVKLSERVSSDFSIQTAITQRAPGQ